MESFVIVRHSVESIADHPVVQDYLRAYNIVMDFKDSLITALRDKGTKIGAHSSLVMQSMARNNATKESNKHL